MLRLWVEELERRLVPSAVFSTSSNWSGYAIQGKAGSVSYVSGSWVVPTALSDVRGYSATWVGIDGWRSNTVEQIGTESDYYAGQAHYYAWYEMYPSVSKKIDAPISPGDTISASVQYAASTGFTLTIDASSWTQPFAVTISKHAAQAQRSSAEWIVEAPSAGRVLPLADFGSETFTSTQAVIGTTPGGTTPGGTTPGTPGGINTAWPQTKVEQVDMVSRNGTQLDTTSGLNATGTSFTVSRDAVVHLFAAPAQKSGGGGSGSGSTSHEPNVPAIVIIMTAPPSSVPVFLLNTPLAPSPGASAPTPITVTTAPTTTGVTSSLAPFGPSAAGDANVPGPAQMRDLPAPAPGAAPAVPNDPAGPAAGSDNGSAPAAVSAPSQLAHPATVRGSAPAWFGALVGDGTRPVVQDGAVAASEPAGPGGSTVEVAGVVLTLAFSGSCGLGLEDDTARRQRRPLSA
jgi:hypothetical protein